jgi:hypothetical protein
MATHQQLVSYNVQVSGFLAAALGDEQFRRIQAAIAVPPLSTCLRVNTLQATVQASNMQLLPLVAGNPSRITSTFGLLGVLVAAMAEEAVHMHAGTGILKNASQQQARQRITTV